MVMSLYIDILNKYKIFNTNEKILLFYLFCFNSKKTVSPKLINNLIISLYNEESITRCLELLFCLKKNVENEYISKIHILIESPENESFLYKVLHHLITIHDNWKTKIILNPIDSRPSYDDIFIYSNNNIIGNVIVANSDIVYDETLKHLFYLTEDDFVSQFATFLRMCQAKDRGSADINVKYNGGSKLDEFFKAHPEYVSFRGKGLRDILTRNDSSNRYGISFIDKSWGSRNQLASSRHCHLS
jgi:hypothetical protein